MNKELKELAYKIQADFEKLGLIIKPIEISDTSLNLEVDLSEFKNSLFKRAIVTLLRRWTDIEPTTTDHSWKVDVFFESNSRSCYGNWPSTIYTKDVRFIVEDDCYYELLISFYLQSILSMAFIVNYIPVGLKEWGGKMENFFTKALFLSPRFKLLRGGGVFSSLSIESGTLPLRVVEIVDGNMKMGDLGVLTVNLLYLNNGVNHINPIFTPTPCLNSGVKLLSPPLPLVLIYNLPQTYSYKEFLSMLLNKDKQIKRIWNNFTNSLIQKLV